MQKKELLLHKRRICYSIEGTGPAVVLLHGFGEDGSIWHYQQRFLRKSFQIIIPDLPGSGCSDTIEVKEMRAASVIEEYAMDIKAVLERESVERCTLIGHSMGGYVTLAFARNYPERLNGLGLFHSTAFADSDEKKSARRKGIKFIRQYGAHEFLKQSIPNLFGEEYSEKHADEIAKLISRSGNFSAAALVQYYEAMMARPDNSLVLKSITIPVLFIMGEEDKSVYLQESLRQCYYPAKALINILPNTAHMGMWEQKDRANDTVLKFLNYVCDA